MMHAIPKNTTGAINIHDEVNDTGTTIPLALNRNLKRRTQVRNQKRYRRPQAAQRQCLEWPPLGHRENDQYYAP